MAFAKRGVAVSPTITPLTKSTIVSEKWYYYLPRSLLDVEPNHLLHYIRFLEPSAIPLPVASTESVVVPSLNIREASISATKQLINVASWFGDRLDELARSMGWKQPVPLASVTIPVFSDWRSAETSNQRINQLITELLGVIEIPEQARGTCRTIVLDNEPLLLFAGAWLLPQKSGESQEWSLLLILVMESGIFLPEGIKLQISDETSVFYEEGPKTDTYWYERVSGKIGEELTLTIILNEQRSPNTFVFNPDGLMNSPKIVL